MAARKTKARTFVGVEGKQRYVAVVVDHKEQFHFVSAAYQEVVRIFERPQFELLLYVVDDFKGVKPESAFTGERLFTELKAKLVGCQRRTTTSARPDVIVTSTRL